MHAEHKICDEDKRVMLDDPNIVVNEKKKADETR
jgi:hypothetical protein